MRRTLVAIATLAIALTTASCGSNTDNLQATKQATQAAEVSPERLTETTTCGSFLTLDEAGQAEFIERETNGQKYDLAKLQSLCSNPDDYLMEVMEDARILLAFDSNSTCADFLGSDQKLRIEALSKATTVPTKDSVVFTDKIVSSRCEGNPQENLIAATESIFATHWQYADAAGLTASVYPTISSLSPTPSTIELKYGFTKEDGWSTAELGKICTVDDQRDAAIEITAILMNTTAGNDLGLGWSTELRYIASADEGEKYSPETSLAPEDRFKFVTIFSDGESVCESALAAEYEGLGGYGMTRSEASAPNESSKDRVYLLIKDYYGPATPDGDTELLSVYGLVARGYKATGGLNLDPQENSPVLLLTGETIEL